MYALWGVTASFSIAPALKTKTMCKIPGCSPAEPCHWCRKHEKKTYQIPKVSTKEKVRQKDYKKARAEYLKLHPVCEIRLPGCNVKANQVHHSAGRIGKLLTDTENFVACCAPCHRKTEDSPAEALAAGVSKKRLNKGI